MTTPLRPGEHVDTEVGTTISRSATDSVFYELKHGGVSVELTRGEIRQFAEFAGFVVIEDAGTP